MNPWDILGWMLVVLLGTAVVVVVFIALYMLTMIVYGTVRGLRDKTNGG